MENKRGKPKAGLIPHMPDESMNSAYMRIKTDGENEAARHTITRRGSSCDFRCGLPIGNGDFGAIIHGYPDCYTYHIAKNDLWWDDYEDDPPCWPACGIEELRHRVKEGDISVKSDIRRSSANRDHVPIQTSAARLTLRFCPSAIFAEVTEKLDLRNGTAVQTFSCGDTNGNIHGSNFSISSSVSRTDEVMEIVCTPSVRAGEVGYFSLELSRDPMEVSEKLADKPDKIKEEKVELDTVYTPEFFEEDGFFGFNMRLRSGKNPETSPDMHYTVLMTAYDNRLTVTPTPSRIIAEGRPKPGALALLLTVVSTYDSADTVTEAKRRLQRASDCDIYAASGSAAETMRGMWKRSWVRLPETKYSLPWYWGIYEAFSARKPGKFAPGYVAPWFASCYANWGYHILTYEQTKSNLGVLASNHAELLEPWFLLCKTAQPKLKKFTKSFYGIDGTCYPHAISGTGTVLASSVWLNDTMMNIQTAGETVKYAWDYYEFTEDIDFLRDIGYELLKNVAIFYNAYLQTEPDGTKVIFPSRAQEYSSPDGTLDQFMTNSLIDLALFRYILTVSAKAADILGVDSDLAAEWRDSVSHLRKGYATWQDGTWKVSEDREETDPTYGVPTVSDLTPISLTDEVDCRHGDPALRETGRKTTMKLTQGRPLTWDMSFGMIARLRYGDREYAKRIFDYLPLFREGGNLNRGDGADLVQFDIPEDGKQDFFVDKGSAYISDVINEMLLQSQGGIISVFPAYPFDLGDAAFCSLRARGAFLVSGEARNGEVSYALIKSIKGNPCTFENAFGESVRVRNIGTDKEIPFTRDGENIIFDTEPECTYVVENAKKPLESFELR